MAASVIARARFRRASASVSFPQPQLHDAGKPTAHNGHLCLCEKIGLGGPFRDQVEDLVRAERHASGVGSLELLRAEVGAHLVEAVLEVARFKFSPRLSSPVEEGLRSAVERSRAVPVASVRGQARQAEAGVGDTETIPVATADPQGCLEAGSRTSGSLSWRSTQPMLTGRSMVSPPTARIACAACCR